MNNRYFELAFTAPVQAWQDRLGSRARYRHAAERDGSEFSDREIEFIEQSDTFFLASVSQTGWPYVQYRGGPAGFVRHLQESEIGWAEFTGNRQYVSSGNADANDRVAMIFIDFVRRRRLKVLGHLKLFQVAERPDLALRLALDGYGGKVERFAVVKVAGFDWNCPQHIARRFSDHDLEQLLEPLQARITELEAQLLTRDSSRVR